MTIKSCHDNHHSNVPSLACTLHTLHHDHKCHDDDDQDDDVDADDDDEDGGHLGGGVGGPLTLDPTPPSCQPPGGQPPLI